MRTKHFFAVALAAVFAASCSNEEFAEMQNGISGKMMDASNFQLVGSRNMDATRVSYDPQFVTIENGSLAAVPTQAVWEAEDAIGFSHIYRLNDEIITNYYFKITSGVGCSDAAEFTTSNSTIFEGDYFVYYPFNDQYAGYDGIPLTIDAIQNQDATTPVQVVAKSDPQTVPAGLADAGAHLPRFSVSDRITAEAHTTQTKFALKQYTSYIGFVIYPLNQTNDINVKRIEMVSNTDTPLEIPVSLRFNVDAANKTKAKAALAEKNATTEKMVLLFDKVDATGGAGGLKIDKDATIASASLGYMGMLPATYAAGTYKFVVYYTENSILKKVEITKNQDLTLVSNKPQFVTLLINANGATEVTDYQIYNETEFASAVAKSNAITNGAVVFDIMNDFEIANTYELKSDVPVTFRGGRTITLKTGAGMKISAAGKLDFQNVIATEAGAGEMKLEVSGKDVAIKGVSGEQLSLQVASGAKVDIINEAAKGELKNVKNNGELRLENVAVKESIENAQVDDAKLTLKNTDITTELKNGNGAAKGDFTLENVTVASTFTNNTASAAASTLKAVTVSGDFVNTEGNLIINGLTAKADVTNTKGTWNVTGTNVLAYNDGVTPIQIENFTNSADQKIDFAASTTTLGNVTNSGKMTLGKNESDVVSVEAKGKTTLSAGSLVKINKAGTYKAVKNLDGLKGDGTETANSTMILEGKLITSGIVTLSGSFKICGIIENLADGSWTLNKSGEQYGVLKFDHSHATEPEFKNAGKVIVEQVTDETATEAINKMSKELYKDNDGTLEWRGISNFRKVNSIVAMGADCFATDLCVVAESSVNDTNFEPGDWSSKNIIVELKNGGYVFYNVALKDDKKQIKANNFTVLFTGSANYSTFTVTGGEELADGGSIKVTNKLSINNSNTYSTANCVDIAGATCKDIDVQNTVAKKFEIKNGRNIWYTGSYTTGGAGENDVQYTNNIPTKKW